MGAKKERKKKKKKKKTKIIIWDSLEMFVEQYYWATTEWRQKEHVALRAQYRHI
jgi:hypothetical protein